MTVCVPEFWATAMQFGCVPLDPPPNRDVIRYYLFCLPEAKRVHVAVDAENDDRGFEPIEQRFRFMLARAYQIVRTSLQHNRLYAPTRNREGKAV